MFNLTINGESRALPSPLTVAELLRTLGHDSEQRRRRGQPRRRSPRRARRAPSRSPATRSRSSPWSAAVPATAAAGRQAAGVGKFTFRSRLITGTGKYASYELHARLPGGQRLRGHHRRRPPRTAGRQGRAKHPRLPRPEALHHPAQHGRLLLGRGRHPPRPAGPRAARQPGQPRRRLGQARMPGRHEDAPARSRRPR